MGLRGSRLLAIFQFNSMTPALEAVCMESLDGQKCMSCVGGCVVQYVDSRLLDPRACVHALALRLLLAPFLLLSRINEIPLQNNYLFHVASKKTNKT